MNKSKTILFLFFVFQFLFSMFSEDLFEVENIFPVYNWKIFHPRPDKYWTRHFIHIHRVDNEVFKDPQDILSLQHKFGKINMYTFTEKIHKLGESFSEPGTQEMLDIINQNLTMNYTYVEWELVEKKFDVILFHLYKQTLQQKSLGRFVATKEDIKQ